MGTMRVNGLLAIKKAGFPALFLRSMRSPDIAVRICTSHGWSFALILALDSAPCLYTRRRELVLAAQLFYVVRVPYWAFPQPTYKYGLLRCCLTLASTIAVAPHSFTIYT